MRQLSIVDNELNDEISSLNSPKFDSLSKLVCYVQHLIDSALFDVNLCDFGSKTLLKSHSEKSSLFFEKYILTAIPDIQLEFLLESAGIFEYDAFLDPDSKFKHVLCEHDNKISELFIPNIKGSRFNPYIRFKSSSVSGSQQVRKLLNLSGVSTTDIFNSDIEHDTIFNLLTLTFPVELSFMLVDPISRSETISRLWACYKRFFKKLSTLLNIDVDSVLGSSASLHLWSSEFPVMPHPHFHMVFPHFSYLNVSKNYRKDVDSMLSHIYDDIRSSMSIVNLPANPLNYKRHHQLPCPEGLSNASPHKTFSHTSIIDKSAYDNALLHLSDELGDYLGFSHLDWSGNVPLNMEPVKKLWTEIVYKEFSDILAGDCSPIKILDIHTEFCKSSDKPKLLHFLQYKCRPPILDLDLLFRKLDGFIVNHHTIKPDTFIDFISNLLTISIKCSDYSKITKYESALNKAEMLFSKFDSTIILDWLKFLCTWKTQTKVFGFWRSITRYCLDPLDENLLPSITTCSICNGSTTELRYVNSPVFDSVIIRSRGSFLVFDIKDPPMGGGKI